MQKIVEKSTRQILRLHNFHSIKAKNVLCSVWCDEVDQRISFKANKAGGEISLPTNHQRYLSQATIKTEHFSHEFDFKR